VRECADTRVVFDPLLSAVASWRKQRAEYEGAIPATLIWKDMDQRRESFVMERGAYDRPGDRVHAGVPAALPALVAQGTNAPTRLDFARWLVDPRHPLTARVTVNRFWQQFFGLGMVETAGDFGSQGEPPRHPELLDWLAVTFRESGWDVRGLVRLLLNSDAYRQSSRVEPEVLAKDPDNRLLARGPRFRLDAEQLRDNAPEGTILVSGVGQHQMWSSQYWTFNEPYTWVNSGGLGTMGFSIPAAIGAKVGRPDRTVWAIDGDGCFQMTAQELVTAAVERIPIKVAILNNSYLGMVRQWQEMFYEERYSEVYLSPEVPNFVLWAEAMGCVGIRVDSPEEVQPAIDKANSIDDRPVVIDFRVDAREKVFPMIPAGFGNSDMLLPEWQEANRGGLK